MQRRKYLATISATVSGVALAGCSSDGDNGDSGDEATPTDSDDGDGGDEATPTDGDDGDGGNEDRPISMEGVTIIDRIFDVRDVNGDGEDDLVIGGRFDNSNSQEAALDVAYEIEFPDGSTASGRGEYTAPSGESTFEGAIRLTAEGDLFTESQVENIKNGEYEYEFWIVDVEGVSAGGSDEGSAEGQCDESVLNDDDSNSVRWEGFANGTTEIESIDLTLESYVDFPASVTITVFFYREPDDIAPMYQVSRTVEIEGRGFRQIQITDTRNAGGWDAEITDLSCP